MVESVLVMLSPAFCDFGWCVAQAANIKGPKYLCQSLGFSAVTFCRDLGRECYATIRSHGGAVVLT